MPIRIAINGFGRIGRMAARVALSRSNIELVAVNDLVAADNLAYLFKHDSVHGRYRDSVEIKLDGIAIGEQFIRVYNHKQPEELPWKELNIDFVIESTGHFANLQGAEAHLKAGAMRVIISAPAKGVPLYIMGVNHTQFQGERDHIISNASCTTNCLAPLCKVLLDHFGIEEGLMTTVHALTASQPVVDSPSRKNWRLGRASLSNIIPSTTGAANAVALCLPQLKGKMTGMAFRVPTPDVSVVDLTVRLERDTSYEEIVQALEDAAKRELKGILQVTHEKVVSSDFIGSPYSCIFDKEAGIQLNPRFYKLITWYDNEMGYSHRLIDLIEFMASKGQP